MRTGFFSSASFVVAVALLWPAGVSTKGQGPAVTSFPEVEHEDHGRPRAILDTLGGMGRHRTFDVSGSVGQAVADTQLVGPRFELRHAMVIVEVGAYVNNCGDIRGGVPFCDPTFPLVLQIHRASPEGLPEPNAIAIFQMTDDREPLTIRYEFARPDLRLPRGHYFALFAPRWATDTGNLISDATNPDFESGPVVLGFLNPQTGVARVGLNLLAAVRILGVPTDSGDDHRDRD